MSSSTTIPTHVPRYHFRISADLRLKMFFDNGRYKRLFGKIRSADPLGFVDSKPYPDRLKVYNKKFGGSDAVVVAQGEINKIPTVVAAMEYGFMGGSMGSAVGEKLTRAIERCLDRKLPLVIISCSGGARCGMPGSWGGRAMPSRWSGSG